MSHKIARAVLRGPVRLASHPRCAPSSHAYQYQLVPRAEIAALNERSAQRESDLKASIDRLRQEKRELEGRLGGVDVKAMQARPPNTAARGLSLLLMASGEQLKPTFAFRTACAVLWQRRRTGGEAAADHARCTSSNAIGSNVAARAGPRFPCVSETLNLF